MSFRTTTMVAKEVIYVLGFGILLPVSFAVPPVILLAIVWLVQRPQIIHRHILPLLFNEVKCMSGSCGAIIPLTQVFQAETFKGNQPTPIWRFRDDRGREAGTLDCPKCGTTIPIQKGRACRLVRVTIIGNPFTRSPREEKRTGLLASYRKLRRLMKGQVTVAVPPMPIGYCRNLRLSRWQRYWQKLTRQSKRRMVEISADVYQRHAVYFGASGMGKSTLIEWQVKWIMENGLGCTVIDPTGRLIKRILKLVPEHRKDDVVLIRAGDRECPFQLNPLETTDEMARFNIKGELLRTIRAVSGSWGDEIAYNLGKAIDTACLLRGSLRDAYDLLTKPTVRDRVIPQLEDEDLLEFWSAWEQTRPKSRVPTIRKLETMMNHPILGPMLGASSSNYSPEDAIRESHVVLVDLHTKSNTKEVIINLGTILIGSTQAAAERQEDGKEVQHFLIIDEARNFMYPGMDLASIFSEARKRKLSMTLATQHPKQLEEVIDEVYGNAGTLLSFKVDTKHAREFQDRMPEVNIDEIVNQDVGQCIAKIHLQSHRIETQLPKPAEEDQTAYIENKMHTMNLARKRDEVAGEGWSAGFETLAEEQEPVCEGVR